MVGASFHTPKGGRFDPDSQPGGAHMGGNQSMCRPPSLSKINLEIHIKSRSGPQPQFRKRELLGRTWGIHREKQRTPRPILEVEVT